MNSTKIPKKEALLLTIGEITVSAITVVVYLLIKKYDYTVLLGAILGCIISVFNFIFLSISVNRAIDRAVESEEFEKLKELVCDLKNYEKLHAGRLYVAKMDIPLLVEYAGIKNNSYDVIHFNIPRYGDGVSWYCNCGLESETDPYAHKCLVIPGCSKMTRRPEQILKNAIEPLFTNFNAFIAWLSGQIKERKY